MIKIQIVVPPRSVYKIEKEDFIYFLSQFETTRAEAKCIGVWVPASKVLPSLEHLKKCSVLALKIRNMITPPSRGGAADISGVKGWSLLMENTRLECF